MKLPTHYDDILSQPIKGTIIEFGGHFHYIKINIIIIEIKYSTMLLLLLCTELHDYLHKFQNLCLLTD